MKVKVQLTATVTVNGRYFICHNVLSFMRNAIT